jgi:hypothetical protein
VLVVLVLQMLLVLLEVTLRFQLSHLLVVVKVQV